jgi:ketosteroid isomerase-like protein
MRSWLEGFSMIRNLVPMIFLLLSGFVIAQTPGSTCRAPEYHQLDFWVGNWDVYEAYGNSPVANVTVDRELDGCVLHERYADNEGHRGESFSTYDAGRKQWRQSWYTNRAKGLELTGGMQGDSLVLTATDYDSTPEAMVRGTWKPLQGSVQETAITSSDSGKTWKTWFDLSFRPARRGPTIEATIQAILELDAEYQNAVKKNDVDTMNRLLPDDFILQSSSGKTYTKSDLLSEARNRVAIYEAQGDREATVRVWGSTAVLTAKLHTKGVEKGEPFDYSQWFSDTYIRTSNGWRYVFGQAGGRVVEPL